MSLQKELQHYSDSLYELDQENNLSKKLSCIHNQLHKKYSFLDRIAVTLYEQDSDLVKSFIHSNRCGEPLRHYQIKLCDTVSLKRLAERHETRVVNDLTVFADNEKKHSQWAISQGYRASYTVPIYQAGNLFGFVFFNSLEQRCFTTDNLANFDMAAHLIMQVIIQELNCWDILFNALNTMQTMAAHRDAETGGHLQRMAHYSRLIAQHIASKAQLSETFIESIYHFAPLHDIGKIAIPDQILLKPAKLTKEEFNIMKTHTQKGREIVESMLDNFGFRNLEGSDVLCNIVELHHEAIDGSGYPHGLCGEQIPIEARIVAVADIFDALTSKRPYKDAWSNDEAFSILQDLIKSHLDEMCVTALLAQTDAIVQIQKRFHEDIFS